MSKFRFTQSNTPKDYFLELSRGNIPGQTHVNKYGRNLDIDNGNTEDIHDAGGTWVAPTQARIHQIKSTSGSDDGDPAGVGAQTVKIYGLLTWDDTAETIESITINGVSNVPTANAYVIIYRMKVTAWGATSINVGTITATADTDGTVTATIRAGIGQTQMAIYAIPSTQKMYITTMFVGLVGAASGKEMVFDLLINDAPDIELTNFKIGHTLGLINIGSSVHHHAFTPYKKIDGPCIVKLQGTADANDMDASGHIDMIIVDN